MSMNSTSSTGGSGSLRITPLRDVIERRMQLRWDQFVQAHPNLAAAIDRTHLVESAVDRLRDDPLFVEAMRQANLDESQLAAAVRALAQAERLIDRLLPV